MFQLRIIALLGMVAILLAACSAAQSEAPQAAPVAVVGAIEIAEPWVRAAIITGAALPATDHGSEHSATEGMNHSADTASADRTMDGMGSTSAAYMVLRNTSGSPDQLVAVQTNAAVAAELHFSEMEGNIMRMRPVAAIEIPANGSAVLETGGYHIMLIGLDAALQAGSSVTMTLTFANAGTVEVSVPVR